LNEKSQKDIYFHNDNNFYKYNSSDNQLIQDKTIDLYVIQVIN